MRCVVARRSSGGNGDSSEKFYFAAIAGQNGLELAKMWPLDGAELASCRELSNGSLTRYIFAVPFKKSLEPSSVVWNRTKRELKS
jgi:hypothetical protein